MVVTGGDIEVKIGRIHEVENRSMTRSKTAEALVLTQIPALITAHQMKVAKIRFDKKRLSSRSKKAHVTVLFAYPKNAVSRVRKRMKPRFLATTVKARILITPAYRAARTLRSKLTVS